MRAERSRGISLGDCDVSGLVELDHLTTNSELEHSEGTGPEECAVMKAREEEGLPGRRGLVKGRPKKSIDVSSTEVIGYMGEGNVRVCDTHQTGGWRNQGH